MFEILRNAWKIKEVRQKILYTVLVLFIFRVGNFITTPFVDLVALQSALQGNTMIGLLDMFNGGAVSNFTIFATGITPYITASIVIQLLTVAIPHLEKLMKEGGEEGRKKMTEYTRYSSIALSLIQSGGYLLAYGRAGTTTDIMLNHSWYAYLTVLMVQAAGAALAMWMGERITEKGVGNGISLLIFINIISRLPVTIGEVSGLSTNSFNLVGLVGFLLMAVFLIASVTFIDLGQRRIPVQYAKRMVGRKVYGGQSTHIPLKLNNSGVLPLIFAMTLVGFPGMILMNFQIGDGWFNHFAQWYLSAGVMGARSAWYLGIQSLLIIFFTYFYSQISFNPIDISKNIQQYGGFIPGIRPGKPTSDYLGRLSNRINLFSSLFFMLLALVPSLFMFLYGQGITNPFGATSILIMVGVALETSKQIEALMLMRHYKGFLT
jgi:preprotein translocase subunit SecY